MKKMYNIFISFILLFFLILIPSKVNAEELFSISSESFTNDKSFNFDSTSNILSFNGLKSSQPEFIDDFSSCSKNIWDFQINTSNWHTTKVINGGNMVQTTIDPSSPYTEFKKFLKAGTYTISFAPHSSINDGFLQIGTSTTNAIFFGNNIIASRTFTLDEDMEIQFRFQAKRSLNAVTLWENIQLEQGFSATSYVPYKSCISNQFMNIIHTFVGTIPPEYHWIDIIGIISIVLILLSNLWRLYDSKSF